MSIVISILLFAASLTFTILFFVMATMGIKNRQIYFEPSCPPIAFGSRPIAFVALCAFYIVVCAVSFIVTVESALRLFKTI